MKQIMLEQLMDTAVEFSFSIPLINISIKRANESDVYKQLGQSLEGKDYIFIEISSLMAACNTVLKSRMLEIQLLVISVDDADLLSNPTIKELLANRTTHDSGTILVTKKAFLKEICTEEEMYKKAAIFDL